MKKIIKFEGYFVASTLAPKLAFNEGAIKLKRDDDRDIRGNKSFDFGIDGMDVKDALMNSCIAEDVEIVTDKSKIKLEEEKYLADKRLEEAKKHRNRVYAEAANLERGL